MRDFDDHQFSMLPADWPESVKSTLLQVVSLAHASIIWTRSWAADSPLQRVRLVGQLERARNEISLLREQMRVNDVRMEKIPAKNRPFYPCVERMAILELKAARGWSLAQTASAFLLDPDTIATWIKRLDEQGTGTLVQVGAPLNKFPAFVRHIVRRLKVLCPTMGKKRIAQLLARAGLMLGATTVGRMLNAPPSTKPSATHIGAPQLQPNVSGRTVTARHPNHVWHVDLTVVPTSAGRWTAFFPFSTPQVWPFCWHVALALDHFSRAILGFAVFPKEPTSVEIRAFLGRVIRSVGAVPRHLICDQGSQFIAEGFKRWCKRKRIRPRYGAIAKFGSIAIIERAIRSLKGECIRQILVPFDRKALRFELGLYVFWHNTHRPHQGLGGRTPHERYHRQPSKRRKFDRVPNAKLPEMKLMVSYHGGRKHLPLVELRHAA